MGIGVGFSTAADKWLQKSDIPKDEVEDSVLSGGCGIGICVVLFNLLQDGGVLNGDVAWLPAIQSNTAFLV